MIQTSLRDRLSFSVGEVMTALLVVQPLLDVLSYFMGLAGGTVFTTTLRMLLLLVVCLYGFIITDNRRAYYVMYGVVGGFWLLHMLNSFRLWLSRPGGDAAEYQADPVPPCGRCPCHFSGNGKIWITRPLVCWQPIWHHPVGNRFVLPWWDIRSILTIIPTEMCSLAF